MFCTLSVVFLFAHQSQTLMYLVVKYRIRNEGRGWYIKRRKSLEILK